MADATVAITAGSGTSIRTVTNAGVDSGAHQQVVGLANSDGSLLPFDPDATLQVSNDPTTLFFDTLDGTLGNFTTSGTAAPTLASGTLTFSNATTASATSLIRTTPSFSMQSQAFLRVSTFVKIDTTALVNNTRWWGYGTAQASPTAAAPVLNGAVFLLDYVAGTLYAAVYSAGTRTVATALTRPSDGAVHKYEVWYKQSFTYWLIDGVTVATASMALPAVTNNQYLIAGSANFTTAPGSGPTFQVTSFSVSDMARNNLAISDGVNPFTKATVKSGANPSPAVTDNPTYVEALQVPSTTATATAATGTAVTVTLAAPGVGLRHYITSIVFEQYATAATTGSATPIVSTASNHNLVATFPTALAIGAMNKDTRTFNSALASVAQNTATSFTCPLTTGIVWRITVAYYIAP